jgi:hypothetical protein
MKKLFPWMMLLFFGATTFQQCTDNENASPEKVQFTCSFKTPEGLNGRTQEDAVPEALILSLETSTGGSVFLHKRVTLLRMGDNFITEPLELAPDRYSITDFMLVKGENEVLFAAPRAGSALASSVNHPLPYAFSVSRNRVSNVAMEVIDVNLAAPEQFGYVSFPISILNVLNLGVLAKNGENLNFVTARAYLLEGDDTVKRFLLKAGVNQIGFPGDKLRPRKLIVTKDGYNYVVKEFVYSDLIEELDGSLWKITIVPSIFTITPFLQGVAGLHYEMGLTGSDGNVTVNWGDGTIEPVALTTEDGGVTLVHDYAAAGNYKINVTGNLNKIIEFYQFYGNGETEAINLNGLTELERLNFGWTPHGPRVVDLSQNTKLKYVLMPNIPQLEQVILADNNVIDYIEITGPNAINTANMDAIINGIYNAVVSRSDVGGSFLAPSHYLPGGDATMVGPPSAAGVARLEELRDSYGWGIHPNPM